MLYMERKLLFK